MLDRCFTMLTVKLNGVSLRSQRVLDLSIWVLVLSLRMLELSICVLVLSIRMLVLKPKGGEKRPHDMLSLT